MNSLTLRCSVNLVKDAGANGLASQHDMDRGSRTSSSHLSDEINGPLWWVEGDNFTCAYGYLLDSTKYQEIQTTLDTIKKRLAQKNFHNEYELLHKLVESGTIWDTPDSEKNSTLKRYGSLKSSYDSLQYIENQMKDYREIQEFLKEAGDEREAFEKEMTKIIENTTGAINDLQIRTFMSSEEDPLGCFIEIQAGAGGKDSNDWVGMLADMYKGWSSNRDFRTEEVDMSPSDTGGYKSITLQCEGEYAFGWMKREIGVHRLIRISPYDSQSRRHTSFASVFVWPMVSDELSKKIEINREDIRIDLTRSSGPGGQNVNKVESAVRVMHIPTGIIIKIQTDRSQHRNKDVAMEMLRSRLYDLDVKKRQKEAQDARSVIGDVAWSSQIRTYTLNPYKDHAITDGHRLILQIGLKLNFE
ncbi:peptide chain release factor 2 [Planoprotostelium fungivorum]|uniref:Peptide chain release factor 2 n=1 Tax=Planoprotostelium fungivorum TaxID=1890364 RepID=A0A2P6NB41_9EUKA|nr:peptide chain release factor 2 [Planoprotostelium fungivorum]